MNRPPVNRLIFDRTIEDIQNRTAKGYFHLADIQRLSDWITYLGDELKLNLAVPQFTFAQALTKANFKAIIDDVEAIKQALPKADDEPATPLPIVWDWIKENDLEKILQIAWEFYYSENIDKIYSGTFRAGNHIKFRSGKGFWN